MPTISPLFSAMGGEIVPIADSAMLSAKLAKSSLRQGEWFHG